MIRKAGNIIIIALIAACIMFFFHFYKKNHEQEVNDRIIRRIAEVDNVYPGESRLSARQDRISEDTFPENHSVCSVSDDIARMIDFAELWQINSEIVAWIEIPGTGIDYPVVQAASDKENDYYLRRNLEGENNSHGTVYTRRNEGKFPAKTDVLYGHNMRDGTMFGTLKYFLEGEFFNEHPFAYVYTPENTLQYRIFAATASDPNDLEITYNNFSTDADRKRLISDLFENRLNGIFDSDILIDEKSNILILSTCTDSAHRLLLYFLRIV